jgi:hypothetical protein
MVNASPTFTCPACGWPGLKRPPYRGRVPSFETCPCCGFEFGFHDYDQGWPLDAFRKKWIAQGMIWYWPPGQAPEGWDPIAQIRRLEEKS